eukprot:5418903-Amphidinium_carterae.1
MAFIPEDSSTHLVCTIQLFNTPNSCTNCWTPKVHPKITASYGVTEDVWMIAGPFRPSLLTPMHVAILL